MMLHVLIYMFYSILSLILATFSKNIPCVLSFIPPESVSSLNQISVVWSVRDMGIWLHLLQVQSLEELQPKLSHAF